MRQKVDKKKEGKIKKNIYVTGASFGEDALSNNAQFKFSPVNSIQCDETRSDVT